jgi:DNA-directed RNA polymerase subunit H
LGTPKPTFARESECSFFPRVFGAKREKGSSEFGRARFFKEFMNTGGSKIAKSKTKSETAKEKIKAKAVSKTTKAKTKAKPKSKTTTAETKSKTAKAKAKPDILKHELVPKHEIISKKEVNDVLMGYNITKGQLPKIFSNDPVVKMIKAEAGDVLKITRDSKTAGKSIFYRVVIAQV